MKTLLFVMILFVLPVAAGILVTFIGKDFLSPKRQFSLSEFLILITAAAITTWLFTAFLQ